MGYQTDQNGNIYIPKGCKVEIMASGDVSWLDMGVVNDTVAASMTWTLNKNEFGNAKPMESAKDMLVDGGFTLVNMPAANVEKLGNGMIETVTTAASPVATIPDQTIDSGWADQVSYPLILQTSSSDSTELRITSAPTLTSVTLDPSGTPEVLVLNSEFVIVADSSSSSGWSIQFISANMSTGSPTTFDIEVDYDTNTPVASTTTYAGTTSLELTEYQMRFTATDTNDLIRRLHLFSVLTQPGGIQFNYKPITDDGVEDMPVTFQAKIDDTLTNGRQLLSWTVEAGAS